MNKHHVRVVPVRVHSYSPELRVDTSRIVGYRAACSCRWRGKVRATVRLARSEATGHGGDRSG